MTANRTSHVDTTNRPHKIIVGVDGSATSQNALAWASALALKHDGHVTAVSTWSYPSAALMPVVGYPVLPSELLEEHARSRLDAFVKASHHPHAVTEQRVIMGSARLVLTELSHDQELLVVGRTGRRALTRRLLGSTATYCAHHARCPIVVVGESTEPEQDILVAVDGSKNSVDALCWALSLGEDRNVTAAFAHDVGQLDMLPLSGAQRAILDARATDIVAKTIDAATAQTGADPGRIASRLLRDDPRTSIVDKADPHDMLVLGAQGHSGAARWALGSLADYAVTHARGTVVVVR